MSTPLTLAMAQLNLTVGDIDGNVSLMVQAAEQARDDSGADVIVFSELCLCGYPPEDLLLRPSLEIRIDEAVDRLRAVMGIDMVVGLPARGAKGLENQAIVLRDGAVIARYAKQSLPNYRVFDEKRYFVPGQNDCSVFECKDVRLGVAICEDLWFEESIQKAKADGAQLILSLNASPFHQSKEEERYKIIRQRCLESGLPVLYVNMSGGQDELVFDGGSFAMNSNGKLAACANHFACEVMTVRFDKEKGLFLHGSRAPELSVNARIYEALVMGVRDYVSKNGFKGVVLGLSGGIDSALTLAIACDALGTDRVQAVMMPFRYTSNISLEDAEAEAKSLGVDYQVIPIEPAFDAMISLLKTQFSDSEGHDTTEENLQSRCRGVLLMAISNRKGYLVLTTGNKSEMAVGYATLYGDMAGGFNALKDVLKTRVYELANYRNSLEPVIPKRVISRAPSAELAPDQKDEDNLPSYQVLDGILRYYIEKDFSAEDIIEEGYNREDVYRVIGLVDRNEFKRRQAAVGVRVTSRGFGRDRRYPITNRWKPGN
ncbi:Glutamine-dependent NAD(+) synthetase [invertebrate metagenome]|uniref:NAD(+) synthase (glutamine-hydrolyzing) n=1 Tax=invertebrate metagenome TaxID=1711999 RepID=A0A2H9TCH0_9ZZZZ